MKKITQKIINSLPKRLMNGVFIDAYNIQHRLVASTLLANKGDCYKGNGYVLVYENDNTKNEGGALSNTNGKL